MSKIDITKPVKLSKPEPGEENLVFTITNYNEETERCYIKPVKLDNWTEGLEPEELVSIHDLVNV